MNKVSPRDTDIREHVKVLIALIGCATEYYYMFVIRKSPLPGSSENCVTVSRAARKNEDALNCESNTRRCVNVRRVNLCQKNVREKHRKCKGNSGWV